MEREPTDYRRDHLHQETFSSFPIFGTTIAIATTTTLRLKQLFRETGQENDMVKNTKTFVDEITKV